MKSSFHKWLIDQKYAENTIGAQMNRAGKIENCYGDLDELYEKDKLKSVIETLEYSTQDARHNRENPSKISINGDIRNNLSSYKSTASRYVRFRKEMIGASYEVSDEEIKKAEIISNKKDENLFGLERDMQNILRVSINQLEGGLEIIDDGAERKVSSGFIDITAKNKSGKIVVIELKAGKARKDAIGQILSYMGDVAEEESESEVYGILVAGDFDSRVIAAAKMVPNLSLKKYSINFNFEEAG